MQTAATIWDCSIVMAKWIESQSVKISGRVLELGAGRGLVSMACRSLGCSISATDMPEALEILQETFNVNDFKDIAVAPLDWKDSKSPLFEKRFDYIVAADVVWVHELIAPLVSTLARMHIFTIGLVSGDTIAFVAHQSRSQRSDNEFFSSLQKNNLSWIALNLGDTIYQKPSCQILHITLKLDSSPTAA